MGLTVAIGFTAAFAAKSGEMSERIAAFRTLVMKFATTFGAEFW